MEAEIYDPSHKGDLFKIAKIFNGKTNNQKDDYILAICEQLLSEKNYTSILNTLLTLAVTETQSEFGTIMVLKPADKIRSSCSSSLPEENFKCIALVEENPGTYYKGLNDQVSNEPHTCKHLKSTSGIFGYIMKKQIVIISNDIMKDPRCVVNDTKETKMKKQYPDEHPIVDKFLGIPLFSTRECGSLDIGLPLINDIFIGILALGCTAKKHMEYTLDTVNKLEYIVKLMSLTTNNIIHSDITSNKVALSYSDTLKNNFFATLSHEIRTPLNGIIGMVTMLGDAGPLNAKQSDYIKNLTDCVFQLSNLMNNILDFSKLMSKKVRLAKYPFSLLTIVEDACKMVEGSLLVKGIEMRKNLLLKTTKGEVQASHKELPMLIGDPQRLTQILTNLLSNAVKFTEKGFISMRVIITYLKNGPMNDDNLSLKIQESDLLPEYKTYKQINIQFEVSDTGCGIPKEEQAKIFEVFHQSHLTYGTMSPHNIHNTHPGTGLGLAIVKELVHLMNGKISVQSEGILGKGSTFSFNVVLDEEINMQTFSFQTASVFKNAKILVVDDRQEIRIQLCELLMKWGCTPIMAASAEEGLRYIKCGMRFNTIIVDICMPYMSGVEMAQELRKIVPKIPLIGLSSAEVHTGEILFDVYLHKPVSQNLLFPAVFQCLKKNADQKCSKTKSSMSLTRSSEKEDLPFLKTGVNFTKLKEDVHINIPNSGVKEQPMKSKITKTKSENLKLTASSSKINSNNSSKINKISKKKLSILVAEDEKHNAFAMSEMLYNLGFRNCDIVENGKLCVEKAKTKKYNIILMDIVMPVMDGIEATNIIRKQQNPPYIIAITAANLNSDKERYQLVGFDAFLSKPITKESLSAVLMPLL